MVEQPRRVRLLLADEQALFREAMRVVLESEGDLKVVAEARDGVQAVMEAERATPDVALLDADLPRCDGVRAAGLIRERFPACGVVIVSSVDSSHLLEQALDVGARGFVTKSSPLSDLLSVTRAVDRGETLIPPGMLGDLVGRWTQRRREQYEAVWLLSKLTKREREVLGLLIEGAGTEAIARSLVISPQTARTSRTSCPSSGCTRDSRRQLSSTTPGCWKDFGTDRPLGRVRSRVSPDSRGRRQRETFDRRRRALRRMADAGIGHRPGRASPPTDPQEDQGPPYHHPVRRGFRRQHAPVRDRDGSRTVRNLDRRRGMQ